MVKAHFAACPVSVGLSAGFASGQVARTDKVLKAAGVGVQ